MDTVQDWLRQNGASVLPDVELREVPGCGRGVFVGPTELAPGGEVCRLPAHLLLTEQTAEASLVFGEALRAMAEEALPPGNSGLLLLTAKLIYDGAQQCCSQSFKSQPQTGRDFFMPYYQVLSPCLDHMPLFWPQASSQSGWRGSRFERALKARRCFAFAGQ